MSRLLSILITDKNIKTINMPYSGNQSSVEMALINPMQMYIFQIDLTYPVYS